ncbi:transient receptor potential cation channel subfamily M member 4-like [Palaemon carinicauda]|uniref:transient receptor potential cation channel subfamily M member 4-like n=1 Tax=Palaemon carinicauda TaxID=392227 RepID=UPI0035B605C9
MADGPLKSYDTFDFGNSKISVYPILQHWAIHPCRYLPLHYRSVGTHVRLQGSSRPDSRSTTITDSLRRSEISLDPFRNFEVSDLTNYSMTDQRWTLQRKKIGLKRKTKGVQQRQKRNLQSKDISISFILSKFTRKECLRYVYNPEGSLPEICYCGLRQDEHIPLTQLLRPFSKSKSSGNPSSFKTLLENPEKEADNNSLTSNMERVLSIGNFSSRSKSLFTRTNTLAPSEILARQTPTIPDDLQSLEQGHSDGGPPLELLLEDNPMIHRREYRQRQDTQDLNQSIGETRIPPVDSKWSPETHYRHFQTNAYGKIEFINETTGSNKPAKYVRLADDTCMESVLTLLSDYWRLLEPNRPQLVISVTGGAKNFKLDGKKKEIFNTGLIKAVKSTNAWIVTGGVNIGVMKSIGEVVNQGQYIVKVKRKTFFAEEKNVLVRGIRCIGVVPWGYIEGRQKLINEDPGEFSQVKYKVQEKSRPHEPVSLNGDHTHFLLIDDGSRNMFRGSDDFRTRLEEAIQVPEPVGFGVPVVLLLIEGGISSITKCAMALRRNIPVVVVAGTGRAADLMAYAVSMTIRTPGGQYIMRKGHRAQLRARVNSTMLEFGDNHGKQKGCTERLIACTAKANLITIFDINSNEAMDKYILYGLLAGGADTSRLDQLTLALLWNRPDIAEQHIFPAQSEWPSGALEDLMTRALLEEKVSFVNLIIINGLVMVDYLKVATLRDLYNKACEPNSHLARLLQKASGQSYYHLVHVHSILQAMMRKHFDPVYLIDTPNALLGRISVNYKTFEDPYQELLLWAIFSGRNHLARYLWERCDFPLSTALAASTLYQSLWRSLGAKNTEIREGYKKQKNQFENLACELMDVCYQEDVINSMGLVERRNAKWGNMDCMEIAALGNSLLFISTPCAQANIELNWRRGMVKAPFLVVFIANFLPFLVFWKKFIRFQKLGDDGGELTTWQKVFVFYKSPISKFCAHSTSFISFLLLYSYVILFDFTYEMSNTEKLVLCWMFSFVVEEVVEILTEQSTTLAGKISDWSNSVWNRFDFLALTLAIIALVLRLFRSTFKWGRIAYAINTTVFYCRLFRIYHVNYHLGPKLIIFNRMIKEVLVFLGLLVIFVLGYGIASQGLQHPSRRIPSLNISSIGMIFEDVLLTPYWQMYGELLLDEVEGNDKDLCHQGSCTLDASCRLENNTCTTTRANCVCESAADYSWVVSVLLFFYLIIGNIMLLNLLIAIFTYVFDEVQENSMELWKFEMYRLIREFDLKPGLVHPFVIFEYTWRLCKKIWKLTCRKSKENLEEYMKETLDALKVFEKEAILNYCSNLAVAQEQRIDNRVKRMSEKIDRITKYIEQKEELEEIEGDLEWVIQEAENMKPDVERRSARLSAKSHRKERRRSMFPKQAPSPPPVPSPTEQKDVDLEEDSCPLFAKSSEELEDIFKEEVSDEDIKQELSHLQEVVLCIERLRWDDNHDDLLADLLFEEQPMSTVCFAIDSGCDRSCITLRTVLMFGLEANIDKSRKVKYRAFGLLDETVGVLKTRLKCQDQNSPVLIEEIEVVKSGHDLVGLDVLKKFSCTIKMHTKSPSLIIRQHEVTAVLDKRLIYKDIEVDGHVVKGLIDTGSCCSFIPQDMVQSLGLRANCLQKPIKVITANKTVIKFKKWVENVQVTLEGFQTKANLIVHHNLKEVMIGTECLQNSRLDFIRNTIRLSMPLPTNTMVSNKPDSKREGTGRGQRA